MTQVLISNLSKEGETRPFRAHGQAVVGSAGAATFMHAVFEPGWEWSKDVAPIAGTSSCMTRHLGYVVSGHMKITMDDGQEYDVREGDMFDLPPGHDAHVVGKAPVVMIDISPQATTYAKGGTAVAQSEDRHIALVRKGFDAFNRGDMKTLRGLMSTDVVQHVPGSSQISGDYKGIDAVLGLYAKIGELTQGTFSAHLVDVHSDAHGHAIATYIASGTRGDVGRVSRSSLLFTFIGDKVTDLLQMSPDLAGDDAFFA
jgi:ketosteroid isomerase-like protein